MVSRDPTGSVKPHAHPFGSRLTEPALESPRSSRIMFVAPPNPTRRRRPAAQWSKVMADVLPADLTQVDPAEAWKPWNPGASGWNRKWAAHLYRRAAFGATPAEMDRALGEGFPKTLERLVAGEPDAAEKLELLNETGQFYNEPANLRAWWLYAMIEGGHPLREKLTLFWHNHFATSYAKVRSTKLMYEQNV